MKYIITESQLELLSELDKFWDEEKWSNNYTMIKDDVIKSIISMFQSSGKSENYIMIYNSSNEGIVQFNELSGELFYDVSINEKYRLLLPHPIWFIHRKYLMSDAFELLFPSINVKSVRSAMFTSI